MACTLVAPDLAPDLAIVSIAVLIDWHIPRSFLLCTDATPNIRDTCGRVRAAE